MEISRLDAWYSNKDGIVEFPATYIVKGLCRRCCLPEVILRCMQVSQEMTLTYIYLCGQNCKTEFLIENLNFRTSNVSRVVDLSDFTQ
jgi:hypothetical protein